MMDNTHRIRFEKPDLSELITRYTVADMHFHSRYSDGMNTIAEIAEQAKALGIGVAITDHNAIEGALEMEDYPNILSIPGIEVTSREGSHLLVYFYETRELKKFYRMDIRPHAGGDVMSSSSLSMEEIVRRAKAYRSLVFFPHPHCAAYTGVCNLQFTEERLHRLFAKIDGIEVINSGNIKKWNLKSALLGFNLDKGISGGSDGHSLKHMGRAVSYADCEPNRAAFLDAVQERRNKVIGKEIALLKKFASNSFRLKMNLRNYPDLVEKNLRYSCRVIHFTSRRWKESVKRSVNGRIGRNGTA
jgi:predicted metal-dependent phosphoesterase TrpH